MFLSRYCSPESVGYVIRQGIKCGDATCRCARGQRHEAFYLVYRTFEDGRWRQRKRYLRKANVPELRRRLAATKARDKALKALGAQARVLRAAVRENSRGILSDSNLLELAHEIDSG